MKTRRSVGVGMIGAGFLAATRARCYAQVVGVDVRLQAVVAGTRANAEEYARRYGVAHVCTGVEELLGRPEVDVVDLCVPNALHRPMAEAAAAAGKHVICTKPLTAYVGQDLPEDATDADIGGRERRRMAEVAATDATAMVAAARRGGVELMYGENWVYAPAIRRAVELLKTSRGAVLEMHGWESHQGSHSPYSKLWRHTGGGALLRLGAHPIGAMLHVKHVEGVARNGQPIQPVAVTASVGDMTAAPGLDDDNTFVVTGWQGVENWGCAILEFADGTRAVARGSDNMLGGMESRLEILASNCHLKCNLSPNDMMRAYAPDPQVFGDEYLMEKVDTRAGWSTPMPSEDWTSGQLAMIQDFVEAVADGRPALSDGQLGLDVTRVVYAAYVSAEQGSRVEL